MSTPLERVRLHHVQPVVWWWYPDQICPVYPGECYMYSVSQKMSPPLNWFQQAEYIFWGHPVVTDKLAELCNKYQHFMATYVIEHLFFLNREPICKSTQRNI